MQKKIKVLYAAFEASPFCKTGGLGDVAGSLPIYLKKEGIDIRVIMPLFSSINDEYRRKMVKICDFTVDLNWRKQYCGVFKLIYKDVIFYFIDNEYYFKRDYPYGFFDDGERIAFYSKALLESLIHLNFSPDVLHLNDWHTALSAVYLREMYNGLEKFQRMKSIFTIHNIKFQGKYSKFVLNDITGLAQIPAAVAQLTDGDSVNFMRGALNYSDRITTVSPTYAGEICSSFYGEGLEDVLNRRRNVLSGILNGIDYEKYNPYKDSEIYIKLKKNGNIAIPSHEKQPNTTLSEFKIKNKMCLQADLGLDLDPNICMIGIVSRLTDQKGFDLINCIMSELLQYKIQIVVLGVGEKKYENAFKHFASCYPKKLSANICFNESLSKKIYASSDAILVPSLFEPCGLSQMYAMRYGALPIVRATGGLKDSVNPYNKFTLEGNGFSFDNYNAHELLYTIQHMMQLYYDYKDNFTKVSMNAFNTDFSWTVSAKKYYELYQNLI